MIVNTVAPATAEQEENTAVAGRIGPEELNHGDTETQSENNLDESLQNGDDEPREQYSAKVELKMHRHDGTVIDLAQVGPDFAILPLNHGHIFSAGHGWQIEINIDGKPDRFEVEVTSDVDFSSDRFNYRRKDPGACYGHGAVAAYTTAAVESQTELSKAEQERLFWEEVRLLGELRDNESQRERLNNELAAARNRQRELQTELNNLTLRIPQIESDVEECCEDTLTLARALWRLKLPASEQPNESRPAIEQPAAEQPAAALPAPEEPSNEWRNLSTAELLAGIKGLGKKKLETLCELAPTVGHLEDLREQASREHKQYNEVLPDGCGAGVAQMIEDRLVTHIANMAKRASAGGNPLADELLNAYRQKAASESWQLDDCVPDSNDTEQTHLGFAAFNEGKPHTALPTQNPELARQWMLGWVCAEIVKHAPPASESEASELAKQQKAEAAADQPEKKPRKTRSTSKKSK